jgi:RHS repeat-associated protein
VHNFVGASVAFTYGYDNVHEMTSLSASDPTYTFHPSAGGTTSYSTASSVNEYPAVGGNSYSYNGNGCLTGDGTWTYGYDTENHLTSMSQSGTSLAYSYDPFHRQAQKAVTITGTTTTRYIYSGWRRIADYSEGGSEALLNRYIYGTRLDEPVIQVTAAGTVTFYHADKQGSIVAITNNSGAVANKNLYGAFGETSLSGTTFGFTGQRLDSETGLYYYKRRYYSPTIGRFLQPDPIATAVEDSICTPT